jgi:glutamyl-tRNA reductase
MKLHLWGTDFRRSPAEMRRGLCIPLEARAARLKSLMKFGFQDLVYLWTCNRVEFYTTAEDYLTDTTKLWAKMLNELGLPEETYFHGYHLEGKAALRHLTRVASSLESLVVGEPQILGQLKDAIQWTKANGFPIDKSLERAFNLAFETAKRVRTETGIAEKPVSVASLGLQHLVLREKDVPATRAVIVGRSPISRIVVEWFQKNRPSVPLLWVNRNPELLKEFAEAKGVELMKLSDFLGTPPAFSHLFTATASLEPIFRKDFLESLTGQKRVLFDFAQPPDIERQIQDGRKDSDLLEIVQMEDLLQEARENSLLRATAIEQAEKLIETSLREYLLEQKEAPILKHFSKVEPVLLQELEETLAFIESEFPAESQGKAKRLVEKIVKKNLHQSREHLRTVLRTITQEPKEPPSIQL